MSTRVTRVVRVGIDDAPPAPMQIGTPESGAFRGYEVDLLKELEARLGFIIQYRAALWSVIVSELSLDNLDLVCSAATVTADRALQVSFCTPHLKLALAVVTRKENSPTPNLSASRVGVRRGTVAEAYFARQTGGREAAMISESNESLYNSLAEGRLDAVIDDSPIALYFSRAIPVLQYAYSLEGTEGEYAIMTSLGNASLRTEIDLTIGELEADGTLPRLRKIWFGTENLFVA